MWIRYVKYLGPLVLVLAIWGYGQYEYRQGVVTTTEKLEKRYLEELVKVQEKNTELVIAQKELEEDSMNEIFDIHENADRYVAAARSNAKRLYVKSESKCLSKDESGTKDVAKERGSAIPTDVAERLIRRREEADRLVVKYNACVDYMNNNYRHINGDK